MKLIKKHWHILILIAFALTPVLWFMGKGDVLINGVDTNFPLDPVMWFKRRLFVWDSTANGGRDFSASTAGLFFHFVQVIPYLLTNNLQITQIVSFVFWFAAIIFSSFFFAKIILPKSKLAQIVLVCIYSFNTYLFNTWENIKVANLALYVSLPLLIGVLVLYKRKKLITRQLILWTAVIAVLASGSGINPSYFLTLILTGFIYVIVSMTTSFTKSNLIVTWRGFGYSLSVLLLVNAFWVVPTLKFLLFSHNPVTGLSDIGFTDWLGSLSENTSLLNVSRLQGAWDWYALDAVSGQPIYLPYVVNYFYRLPFVAFSYLLPGLVFAAFVFRPKSGRNSDLYLLFGVLIILGVFLGAGVHPPTGSLYQLLIRVVPFFAFFRSPWYIFTPLVTLSYAGVIGLVFGELLKFKLRTQKGAFAAQFHFGSKLLAVAFVVCNLLYTYPLTTGKIFRPARRDGFYVTYPGYVWEAAGWLNAKSNEAQRVVTYPDDSIENFEWGYRGIESILSHFTNHEFVAPFLSFQNASQGAILDSVYLSLKTGLYERALASMVYLGADTVFYKGDIANSLAAPISDEVSKLTNLSDFGKWRFLQNKNAVPAKIYAARNYYVNIYDNDSLAGVLPYLAQQSVIAGALDSQISKFEELADQAVIFTKTENVSLDATATQQEFQVEIPKQGFYDLVLDGYGLASPPAEVLVNGELLAESFIQTKGFYVIINVFLGAGSNKIALRLPFVPDLVKPTPTLSLSGSDGAGANPGLIEAYSNSDKNVSVEVPLYDFSDPYSKYTLRYESRYEYGTLPIVELIQGNEKNPLKTFGDTASSVPDWVTTKNDIAPVPTDSYLGLLVTMPANTKGGASKSFFRNFSLKRVFTNELYLVESKQPGSLLTPEIKFTKVSPVEYEVEVQNANNDYFLVFNENYSPEWVLAGAGSGRPVHFTANGFANGWYVTADGPNQQLTVYYKPQKLFHLGLLISSLSLFSFLFCEQIAALLRRVFRS